MPVMYDNAGGMSCEFHLFNKKLEAYISQLK